MIGELRHITGQEHTPPSSGTLDTVGIAKTSWKAWWCACGTERVFFTTRGGGTMKGRMGMGHPGMRKGDAIVLVEGGRMLFVLRPVGWSQSSAAAAGHRKEKGFELVGDAWIGGLMGADVAQRVMADKGLASFDVY